MPIRTHAARFAVLPAAIMGCLCGPVSGAQQELDNLVHERHKSKHNEPHPTEAPGDRFMTSRSSPVELSVPAEQDAFTFVVFGDRTGGPDAGVNVLADAVHNTNLLEPDLVMTVGDLIDGYNQTPDWMAEMREYRGIMDELLCPWFPVAGNHDTYYRGPAANKPEGEHDASYEMHFGPLWYAFDHKNCRFIALYTDEGNPETGEKNFRKPDSQRMSPEQFEWLRATLESAKGKDHVFVFVHHPRWLKGGYGNDWDRVHDLLAGAGNVSAVFAGHIHRMRHDGPFNGIEYVTLATVGGHQSGLAPEAGYLHHFNVVTVRRDQIAMASLPVGEVQDVRAITGQMSDEIAMLARSGATIAQPVTLRASGEANDAFEVELRNPTSQPVRVTLEPAGADNRWWFSPDHLHLELEPSSIQTASMLAYRMGGESIDRAFAMPELALSAEYVVGDFAYRVPEQRVPLPVRAELDAPPRPEAERVLRTGAMGTAVVDAGLIDLPQGPFTLECWFRADSFGRRVGLLAKTENSEYGFFVSDGRPEFSVHLGRAYASAGAAEPVLEPGRWHHIAGVYDGSRVRLFLDGQEIASREAGGERTANSFPLVVGADVDGRGRPTSPFDGVIDEVRLSTGAVYTGAFTPARRLSPTGETLLLLHMDAAQGPFLHDASGRGAHAVMRGEPEVVEP